MLSGETIARFADTDIFDLIATGALCFPPHILS